MIANHDLISIQITRLIRVGAWVAGSILLIAATLASGVFLTAFLGQLGGTSTWNRWSSVGQSFGALSTVVSGFALVAFVVTFIFQNRELKTQHAELALQRATLRESQAELYRTTMVGLRKLHMDLLKMAIDDQQLANVWPPLKPGAPPERNRQHLYANLIFQHHWLCLHMSDYNDEHVDSNLRYLFTSPLMREYWDAASTAREFLSPDTKEFFFCHRADEICREYESIVTEVEPISDERMSAFVVGTTKVSSSGGNHSTARGGDYNSGLIQYIDKY